MASFFENLWASVFTPGPTPTLLLATNASFAALQVLLLALLLATYSIHFVILSGLTAGLWWAINWFAGELRAAQEKEEAAKRIRDARRERGKGKEGPGSDGGEAMDSGDDTEVDAEEERKKGKKGGKVKGERQSGGLAATGGQRKESSPPAQYTEVSGGAAGAGTTVAKASLSPLVEQVAKRRSAGESTGELSTDSEWEKVSEEGSRER
ncbi:Pkr1-domain-containing protein [Lophium mytilinum]|uniref:Pkr1-domain-containing protein n=1 Tax=Lophium mytilinum TaxID=390894 RepID=A0A6A6RBA2_9PEZI|nr:Pkr1-domain-containing protein [Lophium mytilinum]